MRRRPFLSSCGFAVALTAGCLSDNSDYGCNERYTLSLSETTLEQIGRENSVATSRLGIFEQELAAKAIEEGRAEITNTYYPSLGTVYKYDSSYYTFDSEESIKQIDGVEYDLEAVSASDEGGSGVAIEQLPKHDRATLWGALGYPTQEELESQYQYDTLLEVGYRTKIRRQQSRLLPEAKFSRIHSHGSTFELTYRKDIRTNSLKIIYSASKIADQASGVGQREVDVAGTTLEWQSLSEDQQDILSRAKEDQYSECRDEGLSEEYEKILASLREVGGTSFKDYLKFKSTWHAVSVDRPPVR